MTKLLMLSRKQIRKSLLKEFDICPLDICRIIMSFLPKRGLYTLVDGLYAFSEIDSSDVHPRVRISWDQCAIYPNGSIIDVIQCADTYYRSHYNGSFIRRMEPYMHIYRFVKLDKRLRLTDIEIRNSGSWVTISYSREPIEDEMYELDPMILMSNNLIVHDDFGSWPKGTSYIIDENHDHLRIINENGYIRVVDNRLPVVNNTIDTGFLKITVIPTDNQKRDLCTSCLRAVENDEPLWYLERGNDLANMNYCDKCLKHSKPKGMQNYRNVHAK